MTDHILIVDDDRLVADTLCLIFQKQGFEASAAYSADEGLSMARVLRPQLLLYDVTMPNKSGLELVAEVEQEIPECRVIVLTAYFSNLVKANEQGKKMPKSMRVMLKPCAPEDLLREVGAMLRRP
jgi:DNA-binding response OmpR family regulator